MENSIHFCNAQGRKLIYIGKKYFIFQGKLSINPRAIGLPIYLIFITYDFLHISYLMEKFIISSPNYIILLIINIIFFIAEIIQTLNTSFTDPGSFLPNTKEDNSNSSEAKLMIATIKHQDYFLKFCSTCKIAKDLRVHHCSDCGLCILRHDHHCIWLSNCIGLNNHKKFVILIFINFVFFIFNPIILIILINTDYDEDLILSSDIFFLYFLLCLNSTIFIFHIFLIFNHIKYIITGQTTSEKIKRGKNANSPFDTGNKCENFSEFLHYPLRYRERIYYNDNSRKFLDRNILIVDYLNGDYYLSSNKKIISHTYIEGGYNYIKNNSIELIDKSTFDGDSDIAKLDE